MATLATFFRRTDTMARSQRVIARAESDPFRLRALPHDDVYLYSKRIDNSRVVRQADPAANRQCWSALTVGALVLAVGGSVVAPGVASILAGYRLESLKQDRQSLEDRKRALDVREAALLSPERLHELAREQQLASPAPGQIVHLDTVASNGHYARVEMPSQGVARR